MSWPLLLAQTPPAPGTPAAPAAPATPAAPASPAAPVTVETPAPAAPSTPAEVPGTPAAPTTPASVEVPIEALSTPAQPGSEVTPGVAQPASGKYEAIQTGGLSAGHWVVLVIFACVCLGLIATVMFSTSKSDVSGGIMGGGASATQFRGKKSGDEQLSQLTSWFAMAFIVMSLAMTFMFR